MSEKDKKRPATCTWLLTALTVLLAALLIWQCVDIYRLGVSPENLTETGVRKADIYTRALVGERLGRVAWAFALWLAALVAALWERWRRHSPKAVLTPPTENRLRLIRARRVPTEAVKREKAFRTRVYWVCGAVCCLCAVLAGVYLLDLRNFTSWDLETVMGAMLLHVGPWVLIAFAALMVTAQVREKSCLRELALLKDAPSQTPAQAEEKPSRAGIVRIALFAAAALLLVWGVCNGGMRDVLVKAINICTECVGLG